MGSGTLIINVASIIAQIIPLDFYIFTIFYAIILADAAITNILKS